jgi:hypothetical protein
LSALLFSVARTGAAETNVIRLAIGPFFAPAGDAPLAKAASELPDLLTASLPQAGRFQLVERDKVNAIWSELHLAEAGLASADTVVKLGKILSCDWLVSGSFVQTESGPQIWVKIINTQDSVVLDLQSVPYAQTNFSVAVGAIANFIAQARPQARPREFIALGRFDDWSISTTHEDWSRRLVVLLEKHFLAAGYGVVEREAVAPIFSEYQFQAAGLTGGSTNRVKLKPAFWIVDGGCKWIHDTEDKLSVSIRVQKMGGGEQMFSFTKPPGDELEKAVLDTVQSALAGAGSPTLAQAQAGEEKIRAEHLQNLERKRDEPPLLRLPTNETFITVTDLSGGKRQLTVDPVFRAQQETHAQEMNQTLLQAILLNPGDMPAKFTLGRELFGSQDAIKNRLGEDLLEEVAASSGARYATRAKNWLADIRTGKITFERDKFGFLNAVIHGQPASLPVISSNAMARGMADLKAKTDRMFTPDKLATPSESTVQIPAAAFTESGQCDGITATKLSKRIVLIACGTSLQSYDLDANSMHEVGLPMKLKSPISAIEADTGVLWLGTGAGLLRVSLADGTVREFTEKDGFPSPAITALRLVGGRLFIGFNGAFGYLDTGSEKFTGLMAGAGLQRDWLLANQAPPDSYIHAIATYDGTNCWITSQHAFQHFDFGSNKWNPATSVEEFKDTGILSDGQISVNSKFVVIENFRHCISASELPGTNWLSVNLKTNSLGFECSAVALDPADPDWVWIGDDNGKISLVDLATFQIIATGQIPPSPQAMVQWIIPAADKVLFMVSENQGHCSLLSLDKSLLFKSNPEATAAKLNEITNVAVRSEHQVSIQEGPGIIAYLNDGPITACAPGKAFGKGTLLVACGTNLESFDWSGVFGFGSGTEFEKFNLPLKVEQPITAIAFDKQDLWLGTDGGGLIRCPQSGAAPGVFGVKDGFPMASIRYLASVPGRLMIGFGHGMDGAFGCLEPDTLKFTGTRPSGISLKTGLESLQPPPRNSVWQIKSNDGTNTFWIASEAALYRLKFDSQQWSLQLPAPDQPDHPRVGGFRTLAAYGDYVATILSSGGVGIYKVSADRWTHLNLSTNQADNFVNTLVIDTFKPNYLWLGGHGRITILDMDTQQIVGEYGIAFQPGAIEYMIIYAGDVFFLGDQDPAGAYQLFHWTKPVY